MRGVTTQVSKPKSNTAFTTALKKNPDNRGYAPSLLRVIVILFHTALAQYKFLTTSGQSSSAAKITCTRRAWFDGAPPVTPSPVPSLTPGRAPVPTISP